MANKLRDPQEGRRIQGGCACNLVIPNSPSWSCKHYRFSYVRFPKDPGTLPYELQVLEYPRLAMRVMSSCLECMDGVAAVLGAEEEVMLMHVVASPMSLIMVVAPWGEGWL